MLTRLATLACLAFASCGTTHYSLSHEFSNGVVAEIEVLGERPRITVENEGPDPLRVEFLGPAEEIVIGAVPALGATMQTLEGPVVVRMTAPKKGRCAFVIIAYASEGLAADLRANPRP